MGIGLEEVDTWISQQGCTATDSACETFLTNAMAGNYTQMKSEIMVPIKKISPYKD
jgi:hypothetical protein